jgi:serine/threonine protein kinase
MVLDYGESLADLSITRAIAVMSTSTVYEAMRGEEKVLLKVAHNGYQDRLKREAIFLADLQMSGQKHPMLPHLLPAHEEADLKLYPYGKSVFQNQTLYYSLFSFTDGDLLKGMLLKNPQPWFQHAGWIVISLSDVLGLMHQNGRLHLCLSPESIYIRFDKERIPRPMLLDLGAVVEPKDVNTHWHHSFLPTAYVAPELIRTQNRRVGVFTDVYGVGMILYEMLAGRPAYDHRLRSDEVIRRDILQRPPAKMNRPDLKGVPQVAEKAISKDFSQRQPDILTLASQLLASFPPVPKEKKERKFNWNTFAVIVGAAMVIALLMVLALSLSDAAAAITG